MVMVTYRELEREKDTPWCTHINDVHDLPTHLPLLWEIVPAHNGSTLTRAGLTATVCQISLENECSKAAKWSAKY